MKLLKFPHGVHTNPALFHTLTPTSSTFLTNGHLDLYWNTCEALQGPACRGCTQSCSHTPTCGIPSVGSWTSATGHNKQKHIMVSMAPPRMHKVLLGTVAVQTVSSLPLSLPFSFQPPLPFPFQPSLPFPFQPPLPFSLFLFPTTISTQFIRWPTSMWSAHGTP